MDPGSFFLMLIFALVVLGGGIVYVAGRVVGRREAGGAEGRSEKRVRHAVSSPYHERTDLTAGARERDRTTENPEHQADDA